MTAITTIASRLIELCNAGQFVDAYTELFSDNAISIDPIAGPEPIKGLQALIQREQDFLANTEIHEVKVSDAISTGSYFSVIFSLHITPKGGDSRRVVELAVYKVENGKIVSQQFFIDRN